MKKDVYSRGSLSYLNMMSSQIFVIKGMCQLSICQLLLPTSPTVKHKSYKNTVGVSWRVGV